MRAFEKFISQATMFFGGMVLCLMVLQIMIDVVMRSFFGAGFPATVELVSKYYMVTVSFLPVAFTEVKRRHIEATIFSDILPQSMKSPILFGGFIISTVVFGALTFGTGREAFRQTSQGAYVEAGAMDFYTWPSYWILPISFGLMTILLAARVISVLSGTFHDGPHDPLEEIDSHANGDT